jgi:hypothetical protein
MASRSNSWPSARFVAVAALAISTSALPAFAQSASDRETARSLMDKGEAAMAKNDPAAALASFRAADEIMRVPTTGIAVARAQAELGQLVEARDTALKVTRIPAKPGEPPVFAEARSEAQQLADRLAGRIPSLTIQLEGGPASGASVRLDGSDVPPSLLGIAKKLDPGKHVVVASAPGFQEARAEVELAEGAQEQVVLKLEPQTGQAETPIAPSPVADDAGGGTSPLVYIGFGVGAVGIAVGSVTGLMSLSEASTAKEGCTDNICPTKNEEAADSSKTLANISNVGFAVGLIGIGVGIYGLLSSGSTTEAPASARPRPIEPLIGARFVGVRGAF